MPNKKQAKVDVREWVLTPQDQRIPKMSLMKKTGIKDVRTLNNYIEEVKKTLTPPDEYDPENYLYEKAQKIDDALIKACERTSPGALKIYYQLTKRLIERSENLNIDLTADDITRRNLEAERRLRESGYRVEDVQEERPLLSEDASLPSGQGTQGDN